jgi:hypothetical protein
MNNLMEQMIQVVESNAVDNKAVIPNVEAWAIAWREEAKKVETDPWLYVYAEFIRKSDKFTVSHFFDYLSDNYENPTRKRNDKAAISKV